MIVTSILFAVFHLSLHRFFPVFLLGLAISFVVWKSRSIFTGVLLHLLNNGLAVFLINYPGYDSLGLMAEKPSLLMFVIGSGIIFLSLLLLNAKSGPTNLPDSPA